MSCLLFNQLSATRREFASNTAMSFLRAKRALILCHIYVTLNGAHSVLFVPSLWLLKKQRSVNCAGLSCASRPYTFQGRGYHLAIWQRIH